MSLLRDRARPAVLAAVLASAAMGLFMTAVPGSALASVTCASPVTGSGSSLQSVAQKSVWIPNWTTKNCSVKPTIEYTSTGSGKALKEFGNEGGGLMPTESGNGTKLDGYGGSDDAPTAKQVEEASTAGKKGTTTKQLEIVVPELEASVAMLVHPPTSCKVNTQLELPNAVLSEVWDGVYKASWSKFLSAAGASFTPEKACEKEAITLEAREDGSGTSYVFKAYLNQINTGVWSTFVTDAATWPAAGNVQTVNKGGKAEAEKVKNTEGTVGYAALSDSQNVGFTALTKPGYFWAKVQNGSKAGVNKYADPSTEPTTTKGNANCPSTQPSSHPTKFDGNWNGVLVSDPKIFNDDSEDANPYSICGLSYDITWQHFGLIGAMANVNEYGGTVAAAQEVANSVKDYLTYVVGAGQAKIASAHDGYAALPSGGTTPTVLEVAQSAVSEIGG